MVPSETPFSYVVDEAPQILKDNRGIAPTAIATIRATKMLTSKTVTIKETNEGTYHKDASVCHVDDI